MLLLGWIVERTLQGLCVCVCVSVCVCGGVCVCFRSKQAAHSFAKNLSDTSRR